MHIHRDTTTIIFYGDRVVFVDGNFDVGTVARHCFVNRVVYSFVYQVMKTLFGDVTNIHRRTFANSFQAFQNLNVTRRVIICVVLIFCHFSIVLFPCKDTKKS